ncbi:MAG: hypothetical protein RL106_325 [Bacteroidota bacterium]
MKFKLFSLVFFAVLLASCSLNQDVVDEQMGGEMNFVYPELSTLIIPVSLDMRSIERKVNSSIPWEFKNPEWPGFASGACKDPKVKYTLKRDSLHFKVDGNTLYFDVNLRYGIEGEMCPACWGETCASPMVPFSCGVGKEEPRTMHWKGKIIWTIGSNLQLKTRSESLQLVPLSPCEFTWLKLDFTSLVVGQMQQAIQNAFEQSDQALSKRNLQKDIAPLLKELYAGIPIKDQGVLSIVPKKLSVWDLKSKNGRLEAVLGIETQLTMSDFVPNVNELTMPTFSHAPFKEQKSTIRFQLDYSHMAIQKICEQNLIQKKWAISDQPEDYLWIHQCSITGSDDGMLHLNLTMDVVTQKLKRKNVQVEFSAIPVIENGGKHIRLSNPEIDLSGKNQLLEWGLKWESWKSKFQQQNLFLIPLDGSLVKAKEALNQKLLQEQWPDISINGQMDDLRISKIKLNSYSMKINVEATGQWSLIWNKSFN